MRKFLLSFIVLTGFYPVVRAESFQVDGLYYEINENVTGSVNLVAPPIDDPTYIGEIVVPEFVEYENSTFQVTGVKEYAFAFSSELLSVSFPSSITSLGRNTFSGCENLQSVVLPEALTELPLYAFNSCSSLEEIALPEGISSIADYAFNSCSGLKKVELPSGLSSIGNGVFNGCFSLEDITLPSGLQHIGNNAFNQCSSLESLLLPESLTEIPEGLFRDCSSLKEMDFPPSVVSIGNASFRNCYSLEKIVLPASIEEIGPHAFELCVNLSQIEFNSEKLIIEEYAFSGCSSLENALLNGTVEIKGYAFENNDALSTVVFPSELHSIGNNAFANSRNITSVYSHAEIPPYLPKNAFENIVYVQATLFVVKDLLQLYRQTPAWSLFVNVEDTMTDDGVEDVLSDNLQISVANNAITVQGLLSESNYVIYNLTGQVVSKGLIADGQNIEGLANGSLYILFIDGKSFKVSF